MTTATTLKLERHRYAPELNKVHLKNGTVLKAPGCATVTEWRAKRKPLSGIWVEVRKTYDDPKHKFLEATYRGFVPHRAQALEFRNRVKAWGLPTAKITVRTQLVGG